MSTPIIQLTSNGDTSSTSPKIQLLGTISTGGSSEGGSAECSGEHVITVEELPTENIDTNAFYKTVVSMPFSDLIVCGEGEAISFVEMYTQYGMTVECSTIPTKTTDGIKALDFNTGLTPLYYIEDENDVFMYGDMSGTGTNEWMQFGAAFGSSDEPFIYGGSISDISEATTDGYYYSLGGGTAIKYYKYRDPELIDVILFDSTASSLGPDTSGLYYTSTKPTTDIKVSDLTNYVFYIYYIEDEHDLFVYGDIDGTGTNDWSSISLMWTPEGPTFQGAITDSTQATEPGYYAIINESGFKELIIPIGTATLTEQGEHDVSRFAKAIVKIINDDPAIYFAKTLDGLPTDAPNGSFGVVINGNSIAAGAAIPVSVGFSGSQGYGYYVWTDGIDTYYSDGYNHYVLDKTINKWVTKTWNKPESVSYLYICGDDIWTDGTNMYVSDSSSQYVLNKETDTWELKTWNWAPTHGWQVWTDGTNTYYSNGSDQYILNKETGEWETKTWNISPSEGRYVWTDGTNVYYSAAVYSSDVQYILNKETGEWETKVWKGASPVYGYCVWKDPDGTYYHCNGNDSYIVLNKETGEWETRWLNSPRVNIYGDNVWTDGTFCYVGTGFGQFLFAPAPMLYVRNQNEWDKTASIGEPNIITSKEITENGTYNAKSTTALGYASITTKIPTTYMAASLDELPSDAVEGSIALLWEVNK